MLAAVHDDYLHADREIWIVRLRARRDDGQHRSAQYQQRQINNANLRIRWLRCHLKEQAKCAATTFR